MSTLNFLLIVLSIFLFFVVGAIFVLYHFFVILVSNKVEASFSKIKESSAEKFFFFLRGAIKLFSLTMNYVTHLLTPTILFNSDSPFVRLGGIRASVFLGLSRCAGTCFFFSVSRLWV